MIVKRKKLSNETTIRIMSQILDGLKYLHERDIIHRDIKLENILVSDEEEMDIRITDFGLSTIVGNDAFTDLICGTPSYVAPEILTAHRSERGYKQEVDLWSVGVILYICLCGYPPFSVELAPPSLDEQIRSGRISFHSPYWDNVDPRAIDLIKRLLTVDPESRITVQETLEHPWINSIGNIEPAIDQCS
jgi:serine/threonine-protein kinase Chk2